MIFLVTFFQKIGGLQQQNRQTTSNLSSPERGRSPSRASTRGRSPSPQQTTSLTHSRHASRSPMSRQGNLSPFSRLPSPRQAFVQPSKRCVITGINFTFLQLEYK